MTNCMWIADYLTIHNWYRKYSKLFPKSNGILSNTVCLARIISRIRSWWLPWIRWTTHAHNSQKNTHTKKSHSFLTFDRLLSSLLRTLCKCFPFDCYCFDVWINFLYAGAIEKSWFFLRCLQLLTIYGTQCKWVRCRMTWIKDFGFCCV